MGNQGAQQVVAHDRSRSRSARAWSSLRCLVMRPDEGGTVSGDPDDTQPDQRDQSVRAPADHGLVGGDSPAGERALPEFSPSALAWKRAMDVLLASLGLVLAAPLMALIGLLIILFSGRPALFRQQRVGRAGECFTLIKFRTMRPDTDDRVQNDPALWAEYVANNFKLPDKHAEITKVGYALRKLSLDELPQLWNVLRGDMGIVGVRPVTQAEYDSRPPASRALYTLLRPGITGLWQVAGRSLVKHAGRVGLDDQYVTTWKLSGDIKLLFKTPWAVLRPHHTS